MVEVLGYFISVSLSLIIINVKIFWQFWLHVSPQVVLWGIKVPPLAPAGGFERRRHGGGFLPGAYRRHAVLLGQRIRHLRHSGLWAAGPGRPGGLDHVLHRPGHPEHHLDVQDRPRLLQGADRQRRWAEGEGRSRGVVFLRQETRQQPHRLKTCRAEDLETQAGRGAGHPGTSQPPLVATAPACPPHPPIPSVGLWSRWSRLADRAASPQVLTPTQDEAHWVTQAPASAACWVHFSPLLFLIISHPPKAPSSEVPVKDRKAITAEDHKAPSEDNWPPNVCSLLLSLGLRPPSRHTHTVFVNL